MGTYALTGGASGIGASLAKQLREQGHEVINVDIKDADVIADLSSPEGRQAAVAGVRERAPDGLDGLVPLAGDETQALKISEVISFMLSPDSSYICGSVLFINGGFDASTRSDHI